MKVRHRVIAFLSLLSVITYLDRVCISVAGPVSALRKTRINGALKAASIAHVFARSGNRAEAEKILEDLLATAKTKYVSPYDVAVIYAGLNDKERTFEWLNKAYAEHSAFMVYVSSDPRFRPLRGDPPFQELLLRMGFPNRPA